MTKRKKSTKNIEQYDHPNKKRLNNPPVGLVSEDTEPYEDARKIYEYDPHLDPQLQWAGKAEHTSFEVPTRSLHVHERIDPKTIIDTVQKRDVKDRKDENLTAEPEMIKAFRDTWELGIHSYLTYLRDRLLLSRELLTESGSIFVQISDENVHHVRELMDEVFGVGNFVSLITFKKSGSQTAIAVPTVADFLLWYCKEKAYLKFRPLYNKKNIGIESTEFRQLLLKDGKVRAITHEELTGMKPLPKGSKVIKSTDLHSRSGSESTTQPFEFKGKVYKPRVNAGWRTTTEGLKNLAKDGRLLATKNTLRYIHFFDDFPYSGVTSLWDDVMGEANIVYVVQTNHKVIQRCLLMTTDPGDLVFDPTCGSGTTAYVAEQWGRRWITCDTSRVALTLAKQRLMTANFDYYQLAHPHEGVGSGFVYKTVPHITLKSIANNEPPKEETLYDQPKVDRKKTRITGPFTVEAVPSLRARSLEEIEKENQGTGESVARSGETLRQTQWRDELLKSGVRAKGGHKLEFTRVEPMSGTRWIQCEAETREDLSAVPAQAGKPQKVFIVFGPEHAPLEQRMVENAWQEARPFKPDILLFCAFQFDDEAAKDIDELKPEIAGMQLLKVQMNADLFTDDLKKKRSGNDSFWLIGQPDVDIRTITKGEDKGKYQVEVLGFDYYNPKTGNVDSGGKGNIAMWLLDTDYDDRSLFPSQVFFPMAGAKDGWSRLARNLKAEIDEEKIEAFKGTVSLPFEKGDNAKIAVKIIDDRGIESLRVISL